MGEWAPAVGVIGLALVIGATLVLAGPVGKALAEWIRGWSKTDEQWMAMKAAKHGVVLGGDTERLLAELDELKRRVAEAEERLDFTERLLAKERDGQRLARPPRRGWETSSPPSPFFGGAPASRSASRPSAPRGPARSPAKAPL